MGNVAVAAFEKDVPAGLVELLRLVWRHSRGPWDITG